MLWNQLALTEGIRDNQKAITKGFEQFERLADMKELPQIEDFDDDNYDPYYNYFFKRKTKWRRTWIRRKKKYIFDLANRFNDKEIQYI